MKSDHEVAALSAHLSNSVYRVDVTGIQDSCEVLCHLATRLNRLPETNTSSTRLQQRRAEVRDRLVEALQSIPMRDEVELIKTLHCLLQTTKVVSQRIIPLCFSRKTEIKANTEIGSETCLWFVKVALHDRRASVFVGLSFWPVGRRYKPVDGRVLVRSIQLLESIRKRAAEVYMGQTSFSSEIVSLAVQVVSNLIKASIHGPLLRTSSEDAEAARQRQTQRAVNVVNDLLTLALYDHTLGESPVRHSADFISLAASHYHSHYQTSINISSTTFTPPLNMAPVLEASARVLTSSRKDERDCFQARVTAFQENPYAYREDQFGEIQSEVVSLDMFTCGGEHRLAVKDLEPNNNVQITIPLTTSVETGWEYQMERSRMNIHHFNMTPSQEDLYLTLLVNMSAIPAGQRPFPVTAVISPHENPVMMILIGVVMLVYILLLMLARRADTHDMRKGGMVCLADNNVSDTQMYEVVIDNRTPPEHSHFCKDSLGRILKVQVWHNNAGGSPRWFLGQVLVRDLNTGKANYFLCEKWFAVDEGDGRVEREVVAVDNISFAQRRGEFGLLDLSWRSMAVGAICCAIVFPLNLFLTFLFRRSRSILNWQSIQDWAQRQWVKRQQSTRSSANSVKNNAQPATQPCPTQPVQHTLHAGESDVGGRQIFLPAWCRYVAWVLCALISITSATVTILYGFRFGPVKSTFWLQSLYFSFMVCVFLAQPIWILVTVVWVAILNRNNPAVLDHGDDEGEVRDAIEAWHIHQKQVLENSEEAAEIERVMMCLASLVYVACYIYRFVLVSETVEFLRSTFYEQFISLAFLAGWDEGLQLARYCPHLAKFTAVYRRARREIVLLMSSDVLVMGKCELLDYSVQRLLLLAGIRKLTPVHEPEIDLPPECTLAEFEYQVEELLFRMNALAGTTNLPEKPAGYLTDSDQSQANGDDGISSGGSEPQVERSGAMQVEGEGRLEQRVQKIEDKLYANEPYLAQLLKLDSIGCRRPFARKGKTAQLILYCDKGFWLSVQSQISMCQWVPDASPAYYNLGNQTSVDFEVSSERGLTMKYIGDGGLYVAFRQSYVQLVCDQDVEADFKAEGEPVPLSGVYYFTLRSRYACPVGGRNVTTRPPPVTTPPTPGVITVTSGPGPTPDPVYNLKTVVDLLFCLLITAAVGVVVLLLLLVAIIVKRNTLTSLESAPDTAREKWPLP
nr:hypothetical protein BaRGS_029184 [Batillaria attramentaria]